MTRYRVAEEAIRFDQVQDIDVVSALLRGPGYPTERAREVGGRLLERYGDLRQLGAASYDELRTVDGVSEDRAYRLRAVGEFSRRAAESRLRRGERFRCGSDIYRHFSPRLKDLPKEQFFAVLLDGKNRVMRDYRVSEGSLTASLVHPREVFAPAIRDSAGALVFVHNHPSGDPTPSVEDVEITRRLCAVADLVGIRVLDHVVVGDGSYVSFLERGLLGEAPRKL
ncbi:MAG: DNA repair protein RadC [Planctomycetes bacterium]|nr:DNA repair protein RadC [Planctomycetota bacterium]